MSIFFDFFHYVFFEPIYNLLMFIYGITKGFPFGLAIAVVAMTLVVRVLMIPLFMKQLKSQREMQVIGPEVQKIQREFRSEPMVMQQKVNALYKEHGVNPYAGCLPTFVQLPFLYALYNGLRDILDPKKAVADYNHLYPFIRPLYGTSFHAENIHFLWVNLATPDATHILPLFAALLTFISMRMAIVKNKSQQAQQALAKPAATGPDPNAASMKMMQYMMPVVTFISANLFPAGLALYWSTTTAFSIGQQYVVNGRNWGPLLDGIPFIGTKTAPATALVPTSGSSRSSANRRTVVVDSTPSASVNGKQKAGVALLEAPDNDEEKQSIEKVAPKPRPVTRPLTAPRPAVAKKDAVRLVPSANGNGNGNGATAGAPLRVATNANTAAVAVGGRMSRPATVNRPKAAINVNRAAGAKSSQARKKK